MKIRAAYFSQYPLCSHCEASNKTTPATQLDHIIPLHKGGIDDWSNYQSLCTECHKIKTSQDLGHTSKTGCDLSGYPPNWNE